MSCGPRFPFFFSSRRAHTRFDCDWSSDVCSSDLDVVRVSCQDRNIVIETVKKAEDSNDIVVRLYECHNSRGSAELSCVRLPKAAYLCDLEENVVADLDVHDGMVLFDYRPFEIVTIKLQVS